MKEKGAKMKKTKKKKKIKKDNVEQLKMLDRQSGVYIYPAKLEEKK